VEHHPSLRVNTVEYWRSDTDSASSSSNSSSSSSSSSRILSNNRDAHKMMLPSENQDEGEVLISAPTLLPLSRTKPKEEKRIDHIAKVSATTTAAMIINPFPSIMTMAPHILMLLLLFLFYLATKSSSSSSSSSSSMSISFLDANQQNYDNDNGVPEWNPYSWGDLSLQEVFGFDIQTELHPSILHQKQQQQQQEQQQQQQSTSFDINHNTTRFRNFRTHGGVMVFFHLAKTGGTTLRLNWIYYGNADPYVQIETRLLSNMSAYAQAIVDAEFILTNPYQYQQLQQQQQQQQQQFQSSPSPSNNDNEMIQQQSSSSTKNPKILILEMHGILPSLFSMEALLLKWRQLSQQYHTGFVTFSLMREPIQYSVSYFNFYMAAPCSFPKSTGKCENLYESNEMNLIATRRYNHQCQLYARDHWTLFSNQAAKTDPHVTDVECDHVYQSLLRTMDWVGDTNHLSIDTWPFMTQLLWHRSYDSITTTTTTTTVVPLHSVNKAWKPHRISASNISHSTQQSLMDYNLIDRELYRKVTQHYQVLPDVGIF
jgi:hypothetical protein